MVAGAVRNVLSTADDEMLRNHAKLLTVLAEQHGLAEPALGQDNGEIIVTVQAGRDGFDLADYEREVQALLQARVAVTSAGAPGAVPRERLTKA